MKNKLVVLFVLMSIMQSYAQHVRQLMPFKHQNKWGIVNTQNIELVKPIYTDVNIFGDFMYAEFDQEVIYNLQTGEKIPAIGEYRSTITIKGSTFHLFTNDTMSVLIDLDKKDTINLSLKYRWMKTIPLFDENGVEDSTFIISYLYDGDILFLKDDKNLNTLINKRLVSEEIEFISYNNKKIGFVVRKDGYFLFYDHSLTMVKKIVTDKEIRYYEVLSSTARKEIPNIYMQGATTDCFNCEEVWDNSWDLGNGYLNTIAENSKGLDFYIAKEGRYDYFLKNNKDIKFNVEVNLYLMGYYQQYKTVELRETKSLFFYDTRYMNMPTILFPRVYFAETEQ